MPHRLNTALQATAANGADAFIGGSFRTLPGDLSIPYFIARFQLQQFRRDLFDRLDISFPPSPANSVPKRQAEFLAGRVCAGAALARLGHAAAQVGIGEPRSPGWPDGILGSITHYA